MKRSRTRQGLTSKRRASAAQTPGLQLEAMSASRMPVGRVALGTAISRDDLAAEIGRFAQTMAAVGETDVPSDTSRRGAFRGVIPALQRPLRLLDLVSSGTMDGGSFDYLVEVAAPYGSAGPTEALETVEGAV